MLVWNGFGLGDVVVGGTGDKAHCERTWTGVGRDRGWHEFGAGFQILRVGTRVGHGDWRMVTLVAPVWRRGCEREFHALIAPLRRRRRERVTGWARTGGVLKPRHHSDRDHHRHNGHSRLRATRLAKEQGSQPPMGIMAGPKKRYCRPARPSAEPLQPHRLACHPAHRVLHGGLGCETG